MVVVILVAEYKVLFNVEEVVEGIENSENIGDLKIRPNPFSTEATLEWKATRKVHRIDLVNMVGQTVRSIDQPPGRSFTFNRDDLPSGIYFLKVYSDEITVIKVLAK